MDNGQGKDSNLAQTFTIKNKLGLHARAAALFVQLSNKFASETEGEIERFRGALKASREQLIRIKRKMEQDGKGKEHIRIIDAHLMILKDNMLINDTIKAISEQRVNAE